MGCFFVFSSKEENSFLHLWCKKFRPLGSVHNELFFTHRVFWSTTRDTRLFLDPKDLKTILKKNKSVMEKRSQLVSIIFLMRASTIILLNLFLDDRVLKQGSI
nr:hypothetical protein [Rhizoctonia sp.]